MKRIIMLLLVFALMFCTIACSNRRQEHSHNNDINRETQETTGSEDTTSTTQSVEKDEQNLTASVIIRRVNADLAKDNLDPISNIEIKKGAEEGQEVTSFVCVNGLVTVNVTEIGGIVNYVMALCLPSQVMEKIPSKSLAEAAIGAYAYCMVPLFSCEPEIDSSWHQEQFTNAPNEGDSSVVIRSYTSGEWLYTAMLAESYVTCMANRYCSQCKSNAPKVSFTSGAKTCDACNNQSNSDASVNHGNTSNGGNTSQPSATQPPVTQPPTTQPSVTQPSATQPSATQPTAVCSHNYKDATCVSPKTCTLCGQTNGSALGHTYSAATCTAPKTCNSCGATIGSAAGHKWTNITQTVQHEEQGHYEDVAVAKYIKKYKCYACSNKSNTLDEYYSHFDSVHGNSNHYLLVRDRYEIVNDTVYEYETRWIIDKAAHTETVVTGRKCDVCGKEE